MVTFMKPGSKWRSFNGYLADTRVGDILTRTELIERHVNELGEKLTDTYRLYWTTAGYLTLVKPGVYRVRKRIPFPTNLNKIYKEAYGRKSGEPSV